MLRWTRRNAADNPYLVEIGSTSHRRRPYAAGEIIEVPSDLETGPGKLRFEVVRGIAIRTAGSVVCEARGVR